MGTRQFRKTKQGFKLPESISSKNVKKAYSTSKDITIEGYSGNIIHIKSKKEKPADSLPCRPSSNHGAKAWVSVK